MSFSHFSEGTTTDVTIGGTALPGGSVVALTSRCVVTVTAIEANGTGAAYTGGVHLVPKDSSTITQGQKLYFDGTDVTTTASSNTPFGFAWEAAATGVATVKAHLSPF